MDLYRDCNCFSSAKNMCATPDGSKTFSQSFSIAGSVFFTFIRFGATASLLFFFFWKNCLTFVYAAGITRMIPQLSKRFRARKISHAVQGKLCFPCFCGLTEKLYPLPPVSFKFRHKTRTSPFEIDTQQNLTFDNDGRH